MDYGILILIIIILIPLFYLLYFWANSEILNEKEITELSCSKRFWDLHNYFDFTESQFNVNKEFKSALNKNGQLYNCNETLSNFPGIASALLKSKKHEWIIFAFANNKNVNAFYTNKGNDNQSVTPNITPEHITKLANDNNANIVLQFHNHPNAVLSASSQDLTSAKYFGNIFNDNSINYLSFVCGAGRFHQYGWWITESFFSPDQYITAIKNENGKSRSKNFELRKELKRKRGFKILD